MKQCVTCHQYKFANEFAACSHAPDKRQRRCRDCYRVWYAENAQRARTAIESRRAVVREAVKAYVIAHLLENPCVDCGEADVRVLDFDHRVGVDKKLGISRMMAGGHRVETVAAEMAKCDVRCANCHRRRTSERAGWWREAHLPGPFDPSERLRNLLFDSC